MEDTSGFYKREENGNWLFAPNFLLSKDYELYREQKDTYNYPIGGWEWHDEPPQDYLDWLTKQEQI